jgi:hypothetical protein
MLAEANLMLVFSGKIRHLIILFPEIYKYFVFQEIWKVNETELFRALSHVTKGLLEHIIWGEEPQDTWVNKK